MGAAPLSPDARACSTCEPRSLPRRHLCHRCGCPRSGLVPEAGATSPPLAAAESTRVGIHRHLSSNRCQWHSWQDVSAPAPELRIAGLGRTAVFLGRCHGVPLLRELCSCWVRQAAGTGWWPLPHSCTRETMFSDLGVPHASGEALQDKAHTGLELASRSGSGSAVASALCSQRDHSNFAVLLCPRSFATSAAACSASTCAPPPAPLASSSSTHACAPGPRRGGNRSCSWCKSPSEHRAALRTSRRCRRARRGHRLMRRSAARPRRWRCASAGGRPARRARKRRARALWQPARKKGAERGVLVVSRARPDAHSRGGWSASRRLGTFDEIRASTVRARVPAMRRSRVWVDAV